MKAKNAPPISKLLLAASAVILFVRFPARAEIWPSSDLTAPLEADWISARALGLASSCVAVPGDASLSTVNPALLGTTDNSQLGLHHQGSPESVTREGMNVSLPIARLGQAGLHLTYLNQGSFVSRDAAGEISGGFKAHRMGATLGFGREIRSRWAVGGAVRGAWQTIAETRYSMFSFDVGFYGNLGKGFGAGASYSHFGPYLREYLLGSVARIGLSRAFRLDRQITALACFSYDQEPYETQTLRLGLEGAYRSLVTIRAGIQEPFKGNELYGLDNLSFGLGLHIGTLRADIAHFPYGELGAYERVSLAYAWGSPSQKAPPSNNSTTPKTVLKKPTASNAVQSGFPNPAGNASGGVVFQATQTTPTPSPSIPSLSSAHPSIAANPTSTPDDPLRLFFRLPSSNLQETPTVNTILSDKSIQSLLETVDKNRQDPQAWMQLGRLYLQKNRPEQAVQCFEQVLRLRPDYQALRDWLNRHYASRSTPTPSSSE